ncbi:MAG TPA: hypothetical protein VK620_12155, partial [Bradyrhizobium sp.]|nr:hypothetical protein [Bradyrhizobium sp.]
LTWQGSPVVDLDYKHPSVIKRDYPTSPSGIPVVYTFEAGNVKIMPVDDAGLQIVYRQKTPAVSGALNWLWTNYPNAYLFGSLAEAQGLDIDEDKIAVWLKRRDDAFDAIQGRDFRERGPMAMRVMGCTP